MCCVNGHGADSDAQAHSPPGPLSRQDIRPPRVDTRSLPLLRVLTGGGWFPQRPVRTLFVELDRECSRAKSYSSVLLQATLGFSDSLDALRARGGWTQHRLANRPEAEQGTSTASWQSPGLVTQSMTLIHNLEKTLAFTTDLTMAQEGVN